jgi:transcriptional regulator with XRE-family HTH domain
MSENGKPVVKDVPITSAPQLFRVYRRFKGLSQVGLAGKMGIAESAVQAWEAGTSMPKADNQPKLARILGYDPIAGAKLISQWEDTKGRQAKAADRRTKRIDKVLKHRARAKAAKRKRKAVTA